MLCSTLTQEFLVCIEMFIAALAHAYAFPPGDYLDPAHPPLGFTRNMRKMFDVRDVVEDVQEVVDETTESMTQARTADASQGGCCCTNRERTR